MLCAVTSSAENSWMENMKTWRMISCAARVAAPMRLTSVVPYRMTPIVPRLRTDRANPDCKQKGTIEVIICVHYCLKAG